jgi:hypothetical protein
MLGRRNLMKLAAMLSFVAPRLRNEEGCRIAVTSGEPHLGLLPYAKSYGGHKSRLHADALSSGLNAAFNPVAAVLTFGYVVPPLGRLFVHSSRATLTGSTPTCFHHARSSPALFTNAQARYRGFSGLAVGPWMGSAGNVAKRSTACTPRGRMHRNGSSADAGERRWWLPL